MISSEDKDVRKLMDAASQAMAAGRHYDAQRLSKEAETKFPNHPLVLNAISLRKLVAGDSAGALEVLEQALKDRPSDGGLWLNYATAMRDLGRTDDEQAALTKSLLLEPTNLRALLQSAALQERRGDPRTAAATYRKVLSLIPPNIQVPMEMRPILAQARAAVDANNAALEAFLANHLEAQRSRHDNPSLRRFDKSVATLLQKRRVYRQQPTFFYLPELPAIEFYERADFPWLDSIEAATADIRQELVDVLSAGHDQLEPYIARQETPDERWRALNNSRDWGVFYLWKAGEPVEANMARCPKTVAALSAWPKCDLPGSAPTAVFSILEPKTKIPPHTGVNNARLICHLPLIVPPGCGFRVGAETREWQPGKAFVFDDTIEHEAWNNSDDTRAVLIFDIWNPYTTEAEREMVSALTIGVEKFYGELPSYL